MPEEKCQCPLCADPSEAHYDKRDVYDEKILPLEEQIKEICRAEGIPYLMNFQTLSEERGAVFCSAGDYSGRTISGRMGLSMIVSDPSVSNEEIPFVLEVVDQLLQALRANAAKEMRQLQYGDEKIH